MSCGRATEPALRHESGPDAIYHLAGELDDRVATPKTNDAQLTAHPAADLFPPMAPADFAALVSDIKQNGQLEPIVTHDGLILDGRHRYNACLQLGLEPIVSEWNGAGTPESFAISRNLHRRHLDASQRAMVAAAFATLKRGGDHQSANLRNGPTAASLAEMFGVSTRSIETARVVRTKGAPELVDAVWRGAIKVSTAVELVDLPKDRQRDLATAGKYAVSKTVKRIRRTEATRRSSERADEVQAEKSAAQWSQGMSPADDPDFQAEAEAAARDIEIERDERIGLAGAGVIADENDRLKREVAMQDKCIAALNEENSNLKRQVKIWKKRAGDAGWKGRPNA